MVGAFGRRAVIRNLAVGAACSILPAKSTFAASHVFGTRATPPDRWFRITNFPEVDQENTYYPMALEPADGDPTNDLVWRSEQESRDVLLALTLLRLDVAKAFRFDIEVCWRDLNECPVPSCWCRLWRFAPTFRAAISKADLIEDMDIRFAFTDGNKTPLMPPWTIRVYATSFYCPGLSGDFPWVARGPTGFDYVKDDGTIESKPWSGRGIGTPSHIRINADNRVWKRCS